MLHPMMDPLGRFPPGFDRPLALPEFFDMDGEPQYHFSPISVFPLIPLHETDMISLFAEPLIDTYRQHYELPQPAALERLLLLNSAENRLRRQLKQIQLLELFGARRLAEQFAMQLLAAQNALPGLGPPRDLSYGLGPDFDDTYLSPLARDHGGGLVPLEAIGYGNGLANWDFNILSQLIANRGSGSLNNTLTSPLAITRPRSTPLYPALGMPRGYSYPSSWSSRHHHYPTYSNTGAYGGGFWSPGSVSMSAGGGAGGYFGRRTMHPTNMNVNMGIAGPGGVGPSDNIHRVIEAISCDGGRQSSRRRRFNWNHFEKRKKGPPL
jgi:hypothetical protein